MVTIKDYVNSVIDRSAKGSFADFLEWVGEGNGAWNMGQDAIIDDMHEEHGQAWLGKINLYHDTRGQPVLWQYDPDESLPNFCADFVIPCYDAELERLILERDSAPYTGTADDFPRVTAITDRVGVLGGRCLLYT